MGCAFKQSTICRRHSLHWVNKWTTKTIELFEESLKVGLNMNRKNIWSYVEQSSPIWTDTSAVKRWSHIQGITRTNTFVGEEMKRRIRLGWNTFGRHSSILKCSLPVCHEIFTRNVAYDQNTGKETSKCPQKNGKADTGNYRNRETKGQHEMGTRLKWKIYVETLKRRKWSG